jgi:hypothetical protein
VDREDGSVCDTTGKTIVSHMAAMASQATNLRCVRDRITSQTPIKITGSSCRGMSAHHPI